MGAGASVTSVEEVTALDETLQREKADALFTRLDVVADGKLNLMEIKKGFEALEEEGVVVNVSAPTKYLSKASTSYCPQHAHLMKRAFYLSTKSLSSSVYSYIHINSSMSQSCRRRSSPKLRTLTVTKW